MPDAAGRRSLHVRLTAPPYENCPLRCFYRSLTEVGGTRTTSMRLGSGFHDVLEAFITRIGTSRKRSSGACSGYVDPPWGAGSAFSVASTGP